MTSMASLFISFAAAGLALVIFQPVSKNRTKRLLAQGASISLLTVGLFGGLFQIMTI